MLSLQHIMQTKKELYHERITFFDWRSSSQFNINGHDDNGRHCRSSCNDERRDRRAGGKESRNRL